jgi:hypothetical protein
VASEEACKVALSSENRAKLLAETQSSAVAFVEDIDHLRAVVGNHKPDSGELRRISAILRRLLVERDLALIANPRIGKVLLRTPDNNPAYKADKAAPIHFFASGGAVTFGAPMRAVVFRSGGPIPDFDPQRFVLLPLENFLNQRVICLRGDWVSRRDVIKFIANTAHGVHSGSPSDPEAKLIARMRTALIFKMHTDAPGGPLPGFSFYTAALGDAPLSPQPGAVDVALVELLCAAHYLIESESVQALEASIRRELSLPPQPSPHEPAKMET